MRVFISWSGETSHKVADTLYEWLRMIKIPSLEPYISDEIEKGAVWFAELVAGLKSADCGILCLTADNVAAPWLLFEAGALLVAKERSFVLPLLFRFSRSALEGPLTHLQLTEFNQDPEFNRKDIQGLIRSLNRACGEDGLSETDFERLFETWYPALENALLRIPAERRKRKQELPDEVLKVLMKYYPAPDETMEGRRE